MVPGQPQRKREHSFPVFSYVRSRQFLPDSTITVRAVFSERNFFPTKQRNSHVDLVSILIARSNRYKYVRLATHEREGASQVHIVRATISEQTEAGRLVAFGCT